MAKLSPGSALTGSSGRIGNLVTYNLKGTQVVKTLPETSKRKKSTVLQKRHIASFKIQHAVARSVKATIIDRVWSHMTFSGGMNHYNLFIKRNRSAYGKTDHIEFPELMVISDGSLLPVADFTVKKNGKNLEFVWKNNQSGKPASPTDRLHIVLLEYRSWLRIIDIEVQRVECKALIALSKEDNEAVEGYAFWSSENEEMFSPSMYWICR
ncbi:MAG TPA: hypothetical protein VIH57_14590 [Bacteroidales bacterium]